MHVLDAAYHVGQDYPGGASALADRLGCSKNTLAHQLKPSCQTHPLPLQRAVEISELSRDHRILFAFAEQLGYVCLPMPGVASVSDEDLAQALASLGKEFGDVCIAFNNALADTRVTPTECKEFETQISELYAAATEIARRLRAKAAPTLVPLSA